MGQNPLPLFSKSMIELSKEVELKLITLVSEVFVVKSGEALRSIGHFRKCLFRLALVCLCAS